MITLHCPCGATISTGVGPASVTCKCGKVHPLPRLGPAPVAVAPPPAAPPPEPERPRAAEPTSGAGDVRENPFGPRHRVAIHDGMPAPKGENPAFGMLQNPAVAGGISVGVLLVALVVAIALRSRADRLRNEAASADHGTECSFVNAGVAFTAPPGWKLVRNEGMTFAFETPQGEVAVSVLQVNAETHAERVKTFQPTADWKPVEPSELAGAEALAGSWSSDKTREAASWWLDRANHRLWINAEGKTGIRAAAATLIKTMKLTDPAATAPPNNGH